MAEKLLFHAARRGKRHHHTLLVLLLKTGLNPNTTDPHGATALHKASHSGHTSIVTLLLSHGALVTATTLKTLQTPLHHAVAGRLEPALLGNVELEDLCAEEDQVVALLLDAGADINAQDFRGRTVLHEAVWGGYRPIVKVLVERGARTDLKDRDGNTPLSIARRGAVRGVREILVNGVTGVGSGVVEEEKEEEETGAMEKA